METSDRVLRERVPKVRKKRRKNSSPEVSPVAETRKNNNTNTKESIRLQIPEKTSTPVHTHLTQSNFDFSPPGFPVYGEGPEYLEMVKRALQLMVHASRLHTALYENPTNKQIYEHRHLEEARVLLEKVASGRVTEVGEGPGNSISEDNTQNSTRCFVDVSTTTTSEDLSLSDRIHSLECKLDKLLSKPSYASAVQQASPPCGKATSSAHTPSQVRTEDTRFIIEVEDPVPENFNPLPLRETLNQLLPTHCSRFTALRRSRKGNLVCYTQGNPRTTIESFEIWASGIPFGAIRVNAEEKWARRILYLSTPCTSAFELEEELKQFNQGLLLTMTPRLLTPTVALLLFPSEEETPQHLFAFATYRRLASYRIRQAAETARAQRNGKAVEQEVSKARGPENTQGIEMREVVEVIEQAEVMEVVEEAEVVGAVQVVEAMEVVEEGEASGTAQMQEVEEAREAEERKQYYRAKLRQVALKAREDLRIRHEATLL